LEGTGNKPVSGARIFVDNKETNTSSDSYGYYKVKVDPNAVTISVLTPDGRIKTQLINGQTTINLMMDSQTISGLPLKESEATEEKVSIGYTSIDPKKSALTVSNSDVINSTGEENSNFQDIYQMIQDKVPGVDVRGKTIRIRGVTSLNANYDPVFVVDGVPVGSIDYIIPAVVKSITLLKGTSAAIYGSLGANGVIVITLKNNLGE